MRRYHFDATWSGETLHENDCMIPLEHGAWVRYADWRTEREKLIGALEAIKDACTNESFVRIEGNLVGQIIFGEASAKVDAALAEVEGEKR